MTTKRDELLVVGYHGTEYENVENIMQKGLIPGLGDCAEEEGVFFLPEINWCTVAARQMQDPPKEFNQRGKGKDMAIIQLIVPYDWCVNEEYRKKSYDEKRLCIEDMMQGEQTVCRTVPPEMLKVVRVLKANE